MSIELLGGLGFDIQFFFIFHVHDHVVDLIAAILRLLFHHSRLRPRLNKKHRLNRGLLVTLYKLNQVGGVDRGLLREGVYGEGGGFLEFVLAAGDRTQVEQLLPLTPLLMQIRTLPLRRLHLA